MYPNSIGNPGTYPAKNIAVTLGQSIHTFHGFGIGYESTPRFFTYAAALHASHSSLATPSGYSARKNVYRAQFTNLPIGVSSASTSFRK
eukprot:31310-Pelagococcus_subviridis.AAC.5